MCRLVKDYTPVYTDESPQRRVESKKVMQTFHDFLDVNKMCILKNKNHVLIISKRIVKYVC